MTAVEVSKRACPVCRSNQARPLFVDELPVIGVGTRTIGLPWLQPHLRGFFDAHSRKWTETLAGLPIQPPAAIPREPGIVVIISSKAIESTIYESLKHLEAVGVTLVKLYSRSLRVDSLADSPSCLPPSSSRTNF